MFSSLTAHRIKAVRASASKTDDDKMLLMINASDMKGSGVNVSLSFELGPDGNALVESVAKLINEHPGNGGFKDAEAEAG